MEPNFFAAGSPYLAHPLLTPERTAAEADALERLLEAPAGGDLLDVGCGFGRHAIELARRGYRVVGIDPAPAMIAAARARAGSANPELRCQAGEDLDDREAFDGVICLFTTLGQMGASGDNTGLVPRVRSALRPGGRFVVEVPQREAAVARAVPREQLGDTLVTRDVDGAVMTERFDVDRPEGRSTYLLRYRLFSAEELAALLTTGGFARVELFGGFGREPLAADSQQLVAVAVT